MDESAASALMEELALNEGVRLTDVKAQPSYYRWANMPPETFTGHSYCIGDEIVLGTYEDQELRLASFLHELGHILTPDCADEYEEEQRAWRWAFRRARKLGLKFRRSTFAWCRAQLETYRRAG